jgi:Shikimate 5-dehydrogenase
VPDPCRAAVLGSPIEHSLSPVLHTAAYAALGLADWSYTAIECDAGRAARPDRRLRRPVGRAVADHAAEAGGAAAA